MIKYLFQVAQCLRIPGGRGFALLSRVDPHLDVATKIGDMIELHRPDGRIITTTIRGYEILDPPSIDQPKSILVSDIEEVPPGTDVYLIVH